MLINNLSRVVRPFPKKYVIKITFKKNNNQILLDLFIYLYLFIYFAKVQSYKFSNKEKKAIKYWTRHIINLKKIY